VLVGTCVLNQDIINECMEYSITSNQTVASQAGAFVRKMIVTGDLADGERINEVHLAKSLKISRTPLREGLGVLVAGGFVDTIPRRGFFVKPLSAEEFRHLFDLRPLLDPHGLRISSDFSDRQIDRLMRANDDFLSAKDGQSAVRADVKFHRLFLVNCPNLILLDLFDTPD